MLLRCLAHVPCLYVKIKSFARFVPRRSPHTPRLGWQELLRVLLMCVLHGTWPVCQDSHSHLRSTLSALGLKAPMMPLISPAAFLWHTAALKGFVFCPAGRNYAGECFGAEVGHTWNLYPVCPWSLFVFIWNKTNLFGLSSQVMFSRLVDIPVASLWSLCHHTLCRPHLSQRVMPNGSAIFKIILNTKSVYQYTSSKILNSFSQLYILCRFTIPYIPRPPVTILNSTRQWKQLSTFHLPGPLTGVTLQLRFSSFL